MTAVMVKCTNGHAYRLDTERDVFSLRNHHRGEASCPTCGGYGKSIREINGTVNPGRRCDIRCSLGRGPMCVCACGGRNHGRDITRAAISADIADRAADAEIDRVERWTDD